ncbi:hypothetical protein EUX98_g3368 [Antrodiella citrinella]|uniref:Methyltransferase domain-containing protein n=1 Tax=Antrodiella citrinella TaxID=2447956 RepID=A0A4S4MWR2_9APHY|nr:hypothetical protein EUX98_g3368 [Antrodiella citrinella]
MNHTPHTQDHHEHTHNHNYSSANEEFFNNQAETYENKPQAQELARRISKAMRETYPSLFDEDQTSLLDYACGPGLVSRELCAYVKSIVGVDISQGMVDRYNVRVANQGIPPEEMRAVKVELKGDGSELDGARFDVIIVSISLSLSQSLLLLTWNMEHSPYGTDNTLYALCSSIQCVAAYHHFASVDETTRILGSFLKPGGSLLVADIVNDGSDKNPLGHFGHVVAHTAGFSEEEMQRLVEGAGLEDFKFTIAIPNVRLHETDVQIFLAKAVRPQT